MMLNALLDIPNSTGKQTHLCFYCSGVWKGGLQTGKANGLNCILLGMCWGCRRVAEASLCAGYSDVTVSDCRITELSQMGLQEWSCYLRLPLGPYTLSEVRCVSQDSSLLVILMS